MSRDKREKQLMARLAKVVGRSASSTMGERADQRAAIVKALQVEVNADACLAQEALQLVEYDECTRVFAEWKAKGFCYDPKAEVWRKKAEMTPREVEEAEQYAAELHFYD